MRNNNNLSLFELPAQALLPMVTSRADVASTSIAVSLICRHEVLRLYEHYKQDFLAYGYTVQEYVDLSKLEQ